MNTKNDYSQKECFTTCVHDHTYNVKTKAVHPKVAFIQSEIMILNFLVLIVATKFLKVEKFTYLHIYVHLCIYITNQ